MRVRTQLFKTGFEGEMNLPSRQVLGRCEDTPLQGGKRCWGMNRRQYLAYIEPHFMLKYVLYGILDH